MTPGRVRQGPGRRLLEAVEEKLEVKGDRRWIRDLGVAQMGAGESGWKTGWRQIQDVSHAVGKHPGGQRGSVWSEDDLLGGQAVQVWDLSEKFHNYTCKLMVNQPIHCSVSSLVTKQAVVNH